MRRTGTSGWMMKCAPKALRLAAVVLGVGLLVAAGAARAGDDDDEDKPFDQKILEGIMRGMGAVNMENSSIDYRERSPLVVPPKLDLPPPVSASTEANVPNWPKDPDEMRRKAAIAARKKDRNKHRDATQSFNEAAAPVKPSELNVARTLPDPNGAKTSDSQRPGDPNANPLSPSQLGFDNLTSIFHGNTSESTQFKAEPPRTSLVQPPPGYQTPSPNYLYGTGPMKSLNKEINPAAGKYGDD